MKKLITASAVLLTVAATYATKNGNAGHRTALRQQYGNVSDSTPKDTSKASLFIDVSENDTTPKKDTTTKSAMISIRS